MNRAFLAFAQSSCVALAAAASLAVAAEPAKAVKPDPAKGEAIYTKGDAARKIDACIACHGDAGNSSIAANPKLAAQHSGYLVKQLADFKSGARANPVMSGIAKALTDQEMKDISAYLDGRQAKQGAARNKDWAEIGKKIYRAGIAEKNVPACASCHGATGAGIPAQFARLAGQHQDYTVGQLTAFRADSRKNSPQMSTIAKRLSDDEIKAVADYVAGLK
jgi:cytochrome c553